MMKGRADPTTICKQHCLPMMLISANDVISLNVIERMMSEQNELNLKLTTDIQPKTPMSDECRPHLATASMIHTCMYTHCIPIRRDTGHQDCADNNLATIT